MTLEFFIKFVAKRIAKWFKIPEYEWDEFAGAVQRAEEHHERGYLKRRYALNYLQSLWPEVAKFALDIIMHLALAWAVKKGLVSNLDVNEKT